MAYLTLTGDYSYNEYWLRNSSGTTITATNADWHIAANETVPAINIYDSDGVVFNGGEIWGNISQSAEWSTIYNHMATGFRVSDSANVTIRNVHIDGTWDGIRFVPDDSLNVANGSSNGWLVEDVYMHNIRDDAIENDFAHTGTLRDSLLDGVFSAFGTVNDQSAHGALTVDDSIIIMKNYLKDGEMTHGSPFKFNTANPENNPDLKIFNTIIAIQDVTHNGFSRLSEAWDNLTESSGNYYLNLSDTPFPSNYPLPPKGFTILQGQAARDFLASEKAKWLAEHNGAQAPTDSTDSTDLTVVEGSQTIDSDYDCNGDGRGDLALRHSDGSFTSWLGQPNGSMTPNPGSGANPLGTDWQIRGIGDFNGDGRDDILWRQAGGEIGQWLGQSNGVFANNGGAAANAVDNSWTIAGIADFNGDGRDDILWRHNSGEVGQWIGQPSGGFANNGGAAANAVDPSWTVMTTGDFNGDSFADVLWRHTSGVYAEWQGTSTGALVNAGAVTVGGGAVVGSGDFNGDGREDVLTRAGNGSISVALGQANGSFTLFTPGSQVLDLNWKIVGIGDYNGDGRDDLIWRHTSGQAVEWLATGNGEFANNGAIPTVDNSWQIQSPDITLI